ncbi:MAG TPA: lipocalin family protein [Candidatus Paceibacterota bacterium]|nr:lipocalin family protein [Candidatus Paceibacterota bacterium]
MQYGIALLAIIMAAAAGAWYWRAHRSISPAQAQRMLVGTWQLTRGYGEAAGAEDYGTTTLTFNADGTFEYMNTLAATPDTGEWSVVMDPAHEFVSDYGGGAAQPLGKGLFLKETRDGEPEYLTVRFLAPDDISIATLFGMDITDEYQKIR